MSTLASIDWKWWMEAHRVSCVPPWSDSALFVVSLSPLFVTICGVLAINLALTYTFWAIQKRGITITLEWPIVSIQRAKPPTRGDA